MSYISNTYTNRIKTFNVGELWLRFDGEIVRIMTVAKNQINVKRIEDIKGYEFSYYVNKYGCPLNHKIAGHNLQKRISKEKYPEYYL